MGEIPLNCGQVYVSGKLSYASQKPWIFPGSIKDNVLFGQDYDEDRYQRVLDACALERELRLLEHGDKTKICEETPNLSRALKSKVNLAR